jgi:hypothetical protein
VQIFIHALKVCMPLILSEMEAFTNNAQMEIGFWEMFPSKQT